MSAPQDATPIGASEGEELRFHCDGCGYEGDHSELLGVDPDENSTMWCPMCGTSGWTWI